MTEVFYAAVKGSLHANDSSVFGLKPEEISALGRRFPDSNKPVINGVLIKGSPLDVINSLAELGYRVTCSSGETEIVWTLRREALLSERPQTQDKVVSPATSPQATPPLQVTGRPFVVQPSMLRNPVKQVERIGTKPEDWALVEEIREKDRIVPKHISSLEKVEPGQKIILKTNLSSEFNPLSKRPGPRGGPSVALPVTRLKPSQDETPFPAPADPPFQRPSQQREPSPSRQQPAMSHHVANPSVVQTLDEMDFERGLWYPAMQGDLAQIDRVLAKGVDINQTDKSGYTPLHYAVRAGDVTIVRKLLQAGANVHMTTKAGQATPLHRAAAAGHLEVVKLLIEHGADKTPVDSDGRTPLHRSAEAGHESISLYLLRAAPDSLHVRDAKGLSPLEVAKGSLGAIIGAAAESSPPSKQHSGSPPKSRHLEVVKLLIEHGADKTPVDSDGRTPLHRSAEAGHESISLYLLRAAPDSLHVRDAKGLSPLEVAKGSLGAIIGAAAESSPPSKQHSGSPPKSRKSQSKSPAGSPTGSGRSIKSSNSNRSRSNSPNNS